MAIAVEAAIGRFPAQKAPSLTQETFLHANSDAVPLRQRALIVDDELASLDTALGRAAENLAKALEARNVEVVRASSFEDGQAIVGSDASLRAVMLDWNLGLNSDGTSRQATALLHKLRERQAECPYFSSRNANVRGDHDDRGRPDGR